jgi:hypothetical protein
MTLQRLPDGTQNPAWVRERSGKLGGSTISKIITKGKPGELTQGALTLAKKLALERYYGRSFNYAPAGNEDIMRGIEDEPAAVAEYEIARSVFTGPARWVEHPEIEGAGATPDMFVMHDGLAQVKAPRYDNYAMTVLAGKFPAEHVDQMQWEMAVTKRKWNDLVLYCQEFPEGQRLWIRRLHADPERIAVLEAQARLFLAEVEAVFDALPSITFVEES